MTDQIGGVEKLGAVGANSAVSDASTKLADYLKGMHTRWEDKRSYAGKTGEALATVPETDLNREKILSMVKDPRQRSILEVTWTEQDRNTVLAQKLIKGRIEMMSAKAVGSVVLTAIGSVNKGIQQLLSAS